MHSETPTVAPEEEARAFLLLRRPDGQTSFMTATEIFTGSLRDTLRYIRRLPPESQALTYVETAKHSYDAAEVAAMSLTPPS